MCQLISSIALHVFDQMKFSQLYGLPAMCQITNLRFDSSYISAGKRCILKLDVHNKKYTSSKKFTLNPLHPNIIMRILLTVLHTFPKLLTRRICLANKSW